MQSRLQQTAVCQLTAKGINVHTATQFKRFIATGMVSGAQRLASLTGCVCSIIDSLNKAELSNWGRKQIAGV